MPPLTHSRDAATFVAALHALVEAVPDFALTGTLVQRAGERIAVRIHAGGTHDYPFELPHAMHQAFGVMGGAR